MATTRTTMSARATAAAAAAAPRASVHLLTFLLAVSVLYFVDDARQGGHQFQTVFLDQLVAWPASSSSNNTTITSTTSTSTTSISSNPSPLTGLGGLEGSERSGTKDSPIFATDELAAMARRLSPRPLLFISNTTTTNDDEAVHTLKQHQFLHLHHMKTGGTSVDTLISCGLARLRDANLKVNYTNLHECGETQYKKCVTGESEMCLTRVHMAAIMSYCAPLKDLDTPFQWLPAKERQLGGGGSPPTAPTPPTAARISTRGEKEDEENEKEPLHAAVTVLRHPVARVWSMFRFQTNRCYHCMELKDVYHEIDAGNTTFLSRMCRIQLLNHQTRNLLSREPEGDVPNTAAHVEEAIHNMENVFTMIGITEDMEATAEIAAHVFPWLAERPTWKDVVGDRPIRTRTSMPHECRMQHRNSSPSNNHCRANGKKHWNLPDHPDDETAVLIAQHNQMDLQLYEAAIQRFDLQKKALGIL